MERMPRVEVRTVWKSMAALRRLNGMWQQRWRCFGFQRVWMEKAWSEAWLLSTAYHCLSPPLLPAFYQTSVPGIDYTTPFPYPKRSACLSLRVFIVVWTAVSSAWEPLTV